MSAEESPLSSEDAALLLEVEQKIEERIHKVLNKWFHTNNYAITAELYPTMVNRIMSDLNLIAHIGRKLGEREARNYNQ